jgi:predicted phosphodiesterase
MKNLVISDIHANLEAFKSVLEKSGNFDAVWCLGDIVGYGPDPNACINLLKTLPRLSCVLGNHDAAILGDMDVRLFNQEARSSIDWQRTHISIENLTYIKNLPEKINLPCCLLVHGSPRYPLWEYILDPFVARANFDHFIENFCFVGHSHQGLIARWDPSREKMDWNSNVNGNMYKMKPRMILNPGSVGQPRDNDPRASYGIFDDELMSWEVFRVEYSFETTQKKINDLKLPGKNAQRLAGGW